MTSTIIRTFEATRRRAVRRKLRRMAAAVRARMRLPMRALVCLALSAALAVPAAVAIVHLSGARAWPFELLHHFIAPAGIGAAAVCCIATMLRIRALVLPALLLAVWFAVVWASAPLPAATVAGSPARAAVPLAAGSALTLITNNVYVNNDRIDALVSWLASRPADVVVLQEVAPELIKRLKRGDGSYPFRVVGEDVYVYEGGETTEAIAVLSRWPIIGSRPLNAATHSWQAMLVRIDVGGGVRPWIVGVHPPSPVLPGNLPTRDRILADLATIITTLDGPVIVAGDFNSTPYTPAFREFVHAAGVATFGRLPATFPNRLGAAGLPIDHVMVRDARLAELQALPSIGSDHRALAATILLPPG